MSTTTFETDLDPLATEVPATPAAPAFESLIRRMGAEVFGTFVLVLLGAGTMIYSSITGVGAGILGVGLAFAMAVAAAGTAVAQVSGAHFNPAVTLGTAVAGRTPWRDVLPYWLAQIVGATLAGLTLFVVTPSTFATALGLASQRDAIALAANGFGEHSPLAVLSSKAIEVPLQNALIVEALATAVLVGVFLGVTGLRAQVRHAPLFVGLALGGLVIVALPLTNGGLNPARSFGVALFSSSWALSQLWLFTLAPLVGAAVAGAIYRIFVTQVPAAVADSDFVPTFDDNTAADDAEIPAPADEVTAPDAELDDTAPDAELDDTERDEPTPRA